MVARTPLVHVAGVAVELPAGDSVKGIIDDVSTVSAVVSWSASKLNTTLGDISAALTTINGLP